MLIDINQREEWWINFPVYQAHLKGAAALIAVQDQGYGEIHDTSLNAQDIAGPKEAAAFSISQADAAVLKEDMGNVEKLEITQGILKRSRYYLMPSLLWSVTGSPIILPV